MKKKLLFLITLLSLVVPGLSSCSKLSKGNFEIKTQEYYSIGYVGVAYDFKKVLIMEEGIEYSIKAEYYNYNQTKMVELPIDDFCFTPVNTSDISVTIDAHNQDYQKKKILNVRVSVKGDEMDELLATTYSSFCDGGISKELTLDPNEIVSGSSAIRVRYNGMKFYQFGATVIAPNNFRVKNILSDQTWKNAIVNFWVYNPTDYKFEFQLRIKETETLGNVEIDWGYSQNVPQFANPHCWTHIFFSMNKIGINRPLFVDEEGTHEDVLLIKTRWLGTPGSATQPEPYKWNMIIDGYNVEDASLYPQVDTEPEASLETYAQGWENIYLDTAEKSSYGRAKATYSRTVTHGTNSLSSLKSIYKNAVIGDNTVKYGVMLDPENEHARHDEFVIPTFSYGTISADFKFSENIVDRSITFIAVQKTIDESTWDNPVVLSGLELTDVGDGWYNLFFDFAKVPQFTDFRQAIRFGFSFPGVTEETKQDAVIYIDNIFFDQEGTGPAPKYGGRGIGFLPGTDLVIPLGSTLKRSNAEVVFDYKIKSGAETHINIMLFDSSNWDEYIGYIQLEADGTVDGSPTGVTTKLLDDGYYQVKIQAWLVTKTDSGVKPANIDSLFIRKEWSNAKGNIDLISAKEVSVDRGEPFTAGTDYDYFFSKAIDVTGTNTISLDIKRSSGDKIAVSLFDDWDKYTGAYDLFTDLEYDKYPAGVSATDLKDGYIRYTFVLAQLTKDDGKTGLPSKIDHIYFRGDWTEASGLVYVV